MKENNKSKSNEDTPKFPWYIEESKFKEYKLKPVDYEKYTTIVDEKENIRRNSSYSDKLVDKLIDEIDTIPAILKNSAKRFPENHCLGTRYPTGKTKTIPDPKDSEKTKTVDVMEYKWETYSEVWQMVKFFGKGLIQIGLKPKDFVGIYSKNRREWIISLYGTYSQTMVSVAIYDTFGPEVLKYCCEDSNIGTIISEECNLKKILEGLEKEKIEILKTVIVMGDYDEETNKKFSKFNIQLYTFDDILKIGKENDEKCDMNLPEPDDLASIMYTSGSTGDPKGVILKHSNVVATISSVLLTLEIPGSGPIGTDDTYISYLTLAHILERVCCDAMLFVGAKIGFYSGNIKMLVEDMNDLKPTLMAMVPKVISTIKDKIEKTLEKESFIKQKIFEKGYEKQSEAVNHGSRKAFWDLLVFNRIKKELGGNIRLMISGGAPLSEELWEFAKVAFACPVLQGYSLTETAAGGTITNVKDLQLTAGILVPSVEVKLKKCEESGETKEGRKTGEILFRGPSISGGYYNKEEKTKEDFDSDGWFHTGDIGYFTENGSLKIVDRKKNIFKLANGEYIATEKIENAFSSSDLISQIFIHGDSDKDNLIAIIVPDESKLKSWCKENNKDFSSLEEFSKDDELADEFGKYVLEDLSSIGKSSNLKGPEIPSKVIISNEPWTSDNGMCTATQKIKREPIKEKFKDEIEKAYKDIETKSK